MSKWSWRVLTFSVVAALATFGLVGCGGDKQAAAPPAPQASVHAEAAKKSGEDGANEKGDADAKANVKVVDGAAPGSDDRYALVVEPQPAKVGQEATVLVRVEPKAPWHMNLDFPTSLELAAPDTVEMAQTKLKKTDAAALDEDKAQFDVKFTPKAVGEQDFTGTFKFAVCQEDACAPVTENVQFKVAVK